MDHLAFILLLEYVKHAETQREERSYFLPTSTYGSSKLNLSCQEQTQSPPCCLDLFHGPLLTPISELSDYINGDLH